MPGQARKQAGRRAPARAPEPEPGEDDFAPAGSPVVRRTHGSRPENLPPGRRNQSSPVPADPHRESGEDEETSGVEGALRRLSEVSGGDVASHSRAMRQQLLEQRGLAGRVNLGGEEPAQPVREVVAGSYVPDAAEQLAKAVMAAVRLRLVGEGEYAGTWEEWDELAQEALLACCPYDPIETAGPVARFLWGMTGLQRMPEEITDAEQIADVLNMGE